MNNFQIISTIHFGTQFRYIQTIRLQNPTHQDNFSLKRNYTVILRPFDGGICSDIYHYLTV